MSFQQGLSGLNAASQNLDVIGNNIANSSTVGFKGSQAQFADVYANSLNGVAGNQPGMGVSVAAVAQKFTQGDITASANPLDIAINGGGFFSLVGGSGATEYSRNGQFSLNQAGFMVNAQGAQLAGYQADAAGNILSTAPAPLKINNADLSPVATAKVNVSLNLDSRSVAPVDGSGVAIPFSATDPTSYNKQSSINVYDSLGNSHVMSTFYVKSSSATNTWNVYTASDGSETTGLNAAAAVQANTGVAGALATYATDAAASPQVAATLATDSAAYASAAGNAITAAAAAVPPTLPLTTAQATAIAAAATAAGALTGATPASIDAAIAAAVPAVPTGTLRFNSNGVLTNSPPSLTLNLPLAAVTGSKAPLGPITMSFAGSTQFGTTTSDKTATQDGYTAGHLTNFSAGADGILQGQYSNGQSHALGQIVLANFTDPNGLKPLGNNAWAATSASGQPLIGVPNSGSLGVLQSSAVESSNVDLTAELVNLITAQRDYQANAQTIKTQSTVMQTLVNL